MATKDYIEASAAPMAAMRRAHCGDLRRVSRRRQPVVDRGANPAAHDRRIAPSLMPGNQQYDAVPRGNGALQHMIDRGPGTIEVMAMEVEGAVGADISRSQALIPRPVEGRRLQRRPCLP